jgi:hypothetical protein
MRFLSHILRASALATIGVLGGVSFAHAQAKVQPGSSQPNPGQAAVVSPGNLNQTPWFSNPAVRQHLKIDGDQFSGLNNAYQSAWANYQKGINSIDANASAATRQQMMSQLQQNFYNDFAPATTKYLPDVTQRQRFNQVYWQHRGYGAFSDSTVADALNLSPAQRDKLNQHYQDWSTQVGKRSCLPPSSNIYLA